MIFQLCGVKVIVSNNEVLMKIGKKVLGKRMFAALMKPTFYGQFVAGEVKKIKLYNFNQSSTLSGCTKNRSSD